MSEVQGCWTGAKVTAPDRLMGDAMVSANGFDSQRHKPENFVWRRLSKFHYESFYLFFLFFPRTELAGSRDRSG